MGYDAKKGRLEKVVYNHGSARISREKAKREIGIKYILFQ